MNIFDLKRLDPFLFDLFSECQIMANKRREIEEMNILDYELKQRHIAQIKTEVSPSNSKAANLTFLQKGASVEDLGLYFYNPTNDNIELIKDGKNVQVTLDNLQEYIDLALHSIFFETVRTQIQAFKKGFNAVLQIETLRPFDVTQELENLICGCSSNYEEEWTNTQRLFDVIRTDHGFHHKSRAFQDFIRYLTELEPNQRKDFLRFITGSPRLPIGGF